MNKKRLGISMCLSLLVGMTIAECGFRYQNDVVGLVMLLLGLVVAFVSALGIVFAIWYI